MEVIDVVVGAILIEPFGRFFVAVEAFVVAVGGGGGGTLGLVKDFALRTKKCVKNMTLNRLPGISRLILVYINLNLILLSVFWFNDIAIHYT